MGVDCRIIDVAHFLMSPVELRSRHATKEIPKTIKNFFLEQSILISAKYIFMQEKKNPNIFQAQRHGISPTKRGLNAFEKRRNCLSHGSPPLRFFYILFLESVGGSE